MDGICRLDTSCTPLGGVLFAVPFDRRALTVTGGPVPVVEGVKRSSMGTSATTHFSVSSTGSLVFVPGPASTSAGRFDLALFDRDGTVQPLKLPPAPYEYPRLSPNGKQIAVGTDDGKDASVWIYDVSGAASIRRLTLGGRNRVPVWSPDGEHVAFQSNREGDLAIFWQRADGTAPAERLTKPDKDTAHVPESWSPDGKTLLFSVAKGVTYTVAALSLPDKKVTTLAASSRRIRPPRRFRRTGDGWRTGCAARSGYRAIECPAVSADRSDVSGKPRRYPCDVDARWEGTAVLWWVATQAVAVSVTTRPSFTLGKPVPLLSRFLDRGPSYERNHDITLDGQRFLGVVAAELAGANGIAAAPQIQVVLNWFEELKARVPAK